MSRSTDRTLANQSGANYRSEHNSIIAATDSNHLGSGQPSYIATGMDYYDNASTPWVEYVHDGSEDIEKGRVDTTDNLFWTPANLIDANGNEILGNTATTSAVNHINITNAATGNAPTLQAAGDDTNITLNIAAKGTGSVNIPSKFSLSDDGELTISSGAVTITGANHTIDTESDAASDDLDTINGAVDGGVLVLRAANAARTVVLKHNTGNIVTPDGADITLDETSKVVTLVYDAELSDWLVVSAPGVAAGGGGVPNNGYATNRYYMAGLSRELTTGAMTADVLYGVPIIIRDDETFTRIGISVTSGAGNARLGIYNIANGTWGSLILDAGAVDVSTSGEKEATISQALTQGVYLLAVIFSSTPTVRTCTNSSIVQMGYDLFGATVASNGVSASLYNGSVTYGALPSSPSFDQLVSSSGSGANTPALYLRKV